MKMYASCPICGHKLCKGENGSEVDILCPRCGKLVRVGVAGFEPTNDGVRGKLLLQKSAVFARF